MKHIAQETITETLTVIKAVHCDICKRAIDERPEPFTFDIVRVERCHGTRYPEGGTETRDEYDICPQCFKTKLTTWLRSQGAEPTSTEIDL